MYLKQVTSGVMKPGQNDKLVACLDAEKSLGYSIRELQPGFGSAFVSLEGCRLETGQPGAYDPDWFDGIAVFDHYLDSIGIFFFVTQRRKEIQDYDSALFLIIFCVFA